MVKEELKKKFFVSEDAIKDRLEPLIDKVRQHCEVDARGRVYIKNNSLPAKDKIKLVLSARAVAFQLDEQLSADVTVNELVEDTGIPDNQIRARASSILAEKFAVSPQKGVYRAVAQKVESFLDSLPKQAQAAIA
jgi:hypothetical protein